jgi:hypothetical protein
VGDGEGSVVVDGEHQPVWPGRFIAVTRESSRQVRAGDRGLVFDVSCGSPSWRPVRRHGREDGARRESRPVLSRRSAPVEREPVSLGAVRGASAALIVTGVIGGVALLLALVWPWLAWGYIVAALALGIALHLAASHGEKRLEREVERLRQQHRSDQATGGF